ncbi:MAG: MmcQ/YjbR family DNA-binding protein [Clostridia bacterium]|nr:MmcQ/YjbR family DNA-binding protein [Clostridia bacterium]
MDQSAIFKNRKLNIEKLRQYGFSPEGEGYILHRTLPCCGFLLTLKVTGEGEVKTELFDPEVNAPYTLHLASGAGGSFVGGVKSEFEAALFELANKCFDKDVFKSPQAKAIIEYARERYGDELEYLWDKLPDNAVLRRKDTGKWYAALLTVRREKLIKGSSGAAEIIDLRISPDELEKIRDDRKYFAGYHMNKKHWLTIILDGEVPTCELLRRLNESYDLK